MPCVCVCVCVCVCLCACVRAFAQVTVGRGGRPERAHDVVVEELEAALVDVAALLAVEACARRHQLHLDRRREVEVELGDDLPLNRYDGNDRAGACVEGDRRRG